MDDRAVAVVVVVVVNSAIIFCKRNSFCCSMNRCLNPHSALQYESRKGPHHPLVKTSSSERIEQLLLPQQAATGLEMTLKLLSLKILIVFLAFSFTCFTLTLDMFPTFQKM